MAVSEKDCSYNNCKYQEEGKNPPIDFLSEKYYACQFVYTCFFAVHADCYGGEQTYDLDELEEEEEKKGDTESESEEDDDTEMTSYIEELGPLAEPEDDQRDFMAVCSNNKILKRALGVE